MLDLVAVREGGTVADALQIALRTAQHAEKLGFARYWLAEHHNMAGIASSATAVLVGHIAGGTSRIRVGSGGVMLPNHAPLVVAEAFGTLAELYPGRIDLGLGRAPGTDPTTMRALRRSRVETADDFPQDVAELQRLLAPAEPGQRLAVASGPGQRLSVEREDVVQRVARRVGQPVVPEHLRPLVRHPVPRQLADQPDERVPARG